MGTRGRQPAEETVPIETQRELRNALFLRVELIERTRELTDERLASRFHVPVSFVKRLARRIRWLNDPAQILSRVQGLAKKDPDGTWALLRKPDQRVEIVAMQDGWVESPAFLGAVNGDTRIDDIEAMID